MNILKWILNLGIDKKKIKAKVAARAQAARERERELAIEEMKQYIEDVMQIDPAFLRPFSK